MPDEPRFDEEPTGEQLVQNVAYLRGARQDPLPWEEQGGVPTGPMAALTPTLLADLDRRQADPLLVPQHPAPRLTRMQERRRRKAQRRQFVLALGAAALVVFVASFVVGYLY